MASYSLPSCRSKILHGSSPCSLLVIVIRVPIPSYGMTSVNFKLMGPNFRLMSKPTTTTDASSYLLAAPTGAAAGHAAVAASVADHDGSAGVAAGGIAHVVEALHGVGGVVDAPILQVEFAAGLADGSEFGEDASLRSARIAHALWLKATGAGGVRCIVWIPRFACGFARNDTLSGSGFEIGGWAGQSGEETELLAGEEAQLEPAEDVIHDVLGVADVFVAGPARGLKAGVRELLAQDFERDSMLEGNRDGGGEAVHEA